MNKTIADVKTIFGKTTKRKTGVTVVILPLTRHSIVQVASYKDDHQKNVQRLNMIIASLPTLPLAS